MLCENNYFTGEFLLIPNQFSMKRNVLKLSRMLMASMAVALTSASCSQRDEAPKKSVNESDMMQRAAAMGFTQVSRDKVSKMQIYEPESMADMEKFLDYIEGVRKFVAAANSTAKPDVEARNGTPLLRSTRQRQKALLKTRAEQGAMYDLKAVEGFWYGHDRDGYTWEGAKRNYIEVKMKARFSWEFHRHWQIDVNSVELSFLGDLEVMSGIPESTNYIVWEIQHYNITETSVNFRMPVSIGYYFRIGRTYWEEWYDIDIYGRAWPERNRLLISDWSDIWYHDWPY